MEELLILVDEQDRELGTMEKIPVHEKGLLHRAFSIFIFNSKNELILQQRADEKYHSAGLWSNTCCSHPRQGEQVADAVHRRLKEEMGMACELEFKFSFRYRYVFDNGLTEHELDHVYFGKSDASPVVNLDEVKNWKYMAIDDLENDMKEQPSLYTPWLKVCFPKILSYLNPIQ